MLERALDVSVTTTPELLVQRGRMMKIDLLMSLSSPPFSLDQSRPFYESGPSENIGENMEGIFLLRCVRFLFTRPDCGALVVGNHILTDLSTDTRL